jgi:uncharacterized protein YcfJ
MKRLLLVSLLFSTAALADEARVVNVQPRYVTVQQQQCEQRAVEIDNSGQDAVIGGVGGAVVGNAISGRHNKALGTVLGGVAGAVIGNNIGKDGARVEERTVCRNVPISVQQGSIVTFDYHGRIFTETFER